MKIQLDDGAYMPERAHKEDAGLDLRSPVFARIFPGDSAIIDTGVHVQIPYGYAGFLKSKSGLNVKHGIVSEGVIDSGYTGGIVVKLYNHSGFAYDVHPGDKITQLVVLPVALDELELVDKLDDAERGDSGFGSTGR